MRSPETLAIDNNSEYEKGKSRGPLGRLAIRTTAILSGITAVIALSTTADIATAEEARADSGLGYDVNGAEKAWCRWPSRWSLCNQASGLAGEARDAAIWVEGEKGWSADNGGGADAVRHCYWNARMTQTFGEETASGFGWRHEYNDIQDPSDMAMDLHNNQKGRDWASDPNVLFRCMTGVEQGELIVTLAP
jgi:hypothetical protein